MAMSEEVQRNAFYVCEDSALFTIEYYMGIYVVAGAGTSTSLG
jgi:hypothetical protein